MWYGKGEGERWILDNERVVTSFAAGYRDFEYIDTGLEALQEAISEAEESGYKVIWRRSTGVSMPSSDSVTVAGGDTEDSKEQTQP